VGPVGPDVVSLLAPALPDLAPEAVNEPALAFPLVPPLPELPEVGAEITVAGPVDPVDPVFPESDLASELDRE